jgi:hypothetical protein
MKKLFTLFSFLAIAAAGHAQAIKYTDVVPDKTVSDWNSYSVPGGEVWHHIGEVVIKSWGDEQLLCSVDSMPKALNAGDSIAAGSGLWLSCNYQCLNCGGVYGNWIGKTDKYLGVRDKDSNGNWKYGWVRMTIPASAASFTVKDYAMYKKGSDPITAGQLIATTVSHLAANAGHLKLYASGKQVYASGFTGKADVSVMDISGKLLFRKTIDENEALDMSAYGSGIYLFHISDGENSRSAKLSIE